MHQAIPAGRGRRAGLLIAVLAAAIPLYWTNWGKDTIGRARVNGTGVS